MKKNLNSELAENGKGRLTIPLWAENPSERTDNVKHYERFIGKRVNSITEIRQEYEK